MPRIYSKTKPVIYTNFAGLNSSMGEVSMENPEEQRLLAMDNAFCSVRDLASRDPFATRSIIVGLDSYTNVTVAHRDIVYDIHPIVETVHTEQAKPPTQKRVGLILRMAYTPSAPSPR